MPTTYLSLGAFYTADRRREASRERDLGLRWRGDGAHPPTFRVAYVEDTGELYAMQHVGTPGGGRVDVLGWLQSWDDVQRAMRGWEDACGDPGSIYWLLQRVLPAGRAARRGPPLTARTDADVA